TPHPHLIPLKTNPTTLHNQPHHTTPPLLRKLVPARLRATSDAAAEAGAVLRRMAGMTAEEQEQVLEELVQRFSARLLGFGGAEQIDPARDFLESGFDSLSAMELRNQLNEATGLRLPAMAVFDHKTPAELARFVRSELAGRLAQAVSPASSPAAGEPAAGASAEGSGEALRSQTLSAVFREAVHAGRMKSAFALLGAVANVRPSFSSVEELGYVPAPVKLAPGGTITPRLICVSTPMVTGGPYQLARLASHFRGTRTVMGLPLPGFATGESLPATTDAAIEALAASAVEAAEGEPFALVGYSAGGILARVTARHLEDVHGIEPAGLVMLDSYRAETEPGEQDEELVLAMLSKEAAFGGFDVARLSTMGRFVELVPRLDPGEVKAPVLFVQCTELFSPDGDVPAEPGDWQAQPWGDATVRTVAASHFSMLEEKAELTARVIEEWLGA
ncbi:phosphopantetheine-binding protein, partial [Streptomyces sp. NPDC051921]|uniref:phosphopantetheine-binding protein n=1 Tax=Streptomyces sp. NPDC051921 TaxID=3155806 RepID=UPI0034371DB3